MCLPILFAASEVRIVLEEVELKSPLILFQHVHAYPFPLVLYRQSELSRVGLMTQERIGREGLVHRNVLKTEQSPVIVLPFFRGSSLAY